MGDQEQTIWLCLSVLRLVHLLLKICQADYIWEILAMFRHLDEVQGSPYSRGAVGPALLGGSLPRGRGMSHM